MSSRRSRAKSPGGPGFQASDAFSVLTIDLRLRAGEDLLLGHQYQVQGGWSGPLEPSKAFPKQSLGPVARDGSTDLAAGRQPQTIVPAVVGGRHQAEQRPIQAQAAVEDTPVLPRRAESFAACEPAAGQARQGPGAFQAASRLRPFWRRRLSTRRPPLVRIRTRKPWVRFRFRLFGWKVRFMLDCPRPRSRNPLMRGRRHRTKVPTLEGPGALVKPLPWPGSRLVAQSASVVP